MGFTYDIAKLNDRRLGLEFCQEGAVRQLPGGSGLSSTMRNEYLLRDVNADVCSVVVNSGPTMIVITCFAEHQS